MNAVILQRKKKKARYEREKEYMDALVGFGQATGEYIGNGKGEQNDQTLSLPDSQENGMEIEPAEEHLYDFDDDLDPDQNLIESDSENYSITHLL